MDTGWYYPFLLLPLMAIRLMFESIPIEEVFGLPPVTPNSRATEETKQEPTSTAEGRGKGEGTRGKRGKGTERGRGNKQRNKRVS